MISSKLFRWIFIREKMVIYFYLVSFRKSNSLDVEINASGFSKEIQELNEVLDEMNENGGVDNETVETNENNSDDENKDADEKKPDNACSSESKIEESESYDKFEDNVHYLNKKYQPYRDAKESFEKEEESDSDSDNYSCTTTTSTIMDPGMVRSRVRKSLLAKMKTEKRRLRNKGESALATEKVREINDTIKSSLNFD